MANPPAKRTPGLPFRQGQTGSGGMLNGEYPNIGGVRGRFYIAYFGWQRPREWKVVLPRGVEDGATCRIDVVDTWNMKVARLKGRMVLKQKGTHDLTRIEGDVVKLPGRPFMALRIWITEPKDM